ncbi:MAG TPA: hypothetical protein VNI52_08630 [Sphingobacteriaceae bacterium]|nr:hypothetical protein [Sphingobacteriaceae bacterium]
MLKKDNVWLGIALGLVLPGIVFFIVEILKRNVTFLKRDDILYIGSVAINLLLVRYYFRQDKENTARGIIGSTFICSFIFMYYKMRQ